MPRYASHDSRSFTDKIDSDKLTDDLRKRSGAKNANEFRAWLQKNALDIIRQNARADPRHNPYSK